VLIVGELGWLWGWLLCVWRCCYVCGAGDYVALVAIWGWLLCGIGHQISSKIFI